METVSFAVGAGALCAGVYLICNLKQPSQKDCSWPYPYEFTGSRHDVVKGAYFRVAGGSVEEIDAGRRHGTRRCAADKILDVSSDYLVVKNGGVVCLVDVGRKPNDSVEIACAESPSAFISRDAAFVAVHDGKSGRLNMVNAKTRESVFSAAAVSVGRWSGKELPFCVEKEGKTSVRVYDADEKQAMDAVEVEGDQWRDPSLTLDSIVLHGLGRIAVVDRESKRARTTENAFGTVERSELSPSGRYLATVSSANQKERMLRLTDLRSLDEMVLGSGDVRVSMAWSPVDDILAFQAIPDVSGKRVSTNEAIDLMKSVDVSLFDCAARSTRPAFENPGGLDLLCGWGSDGLYIYSDKFASMLARLDCVRIRDGGFDCYVPDGGSGFDRKTVMSNLQVALAGGLSLVPFLPWLLFSLYRRRDRHLRDLKDSGEKGVFDVAVEHPLAVATASCVAASYLIDSMHGGYYRAMLKSLHGPALYSFSVGLAMISMTYVAAADHILTNARSVRSPRFRRYLGLLGLSAKGLMCVGLKKGELETLRDIMHPSTRSAALCEARLRIFDKDYDVAALSLKEAMRHPDDNHALFDPFDALRLPQRMLLLQHSYFDSRKALRRADLGEMIEAQFSALQCGFYSRVPLLSRKILSGPIPKERPELGIMQGLLLSAAGYDSMAGDTLRDAIKLALERNPVWERIGDYDVHRLGGSEFLKSTVLLKRGDKQGLDAEEHLTRHAHDRLSAAGVKTSVVLSSVREHAGAHVLPLLFESGSPLSGCVEVDSYVEAARALGMIHGLLEPRRKDNDDYSLSPQRASRLAALSSLSGLEVLSRMAKGADIQYAAVFKKDPHPENWIRTKDGVVAIDFQPHGSTHPPNELCKLIFQREACALPLLEILLDRCVGAYVAGRKESGKPLASGESRSLVQDMIGVAPFRAASFAAYAADQPSRGPVVRGFIDNVLSVVDRLPNEKGLAKDYLCSLRSALG
jgi:hypothetical protein